MKSLEVAHVTRSNAFAGVERYICVVANALFARGYRVRVIGGDPARMRNELNEGVRHAGAASTNEVFKALASGGRVGLVHAHMTAAEAAALAARAWHRAPVVSTRHFPDRRGHGMPHWVGHLIRRSLAEQVSISRFVAEGIAEPSVLIHNGVLAHGEAGLDSPHILMMQRLEPEKAPDVGLRAWAGSGLSQRGWRFSIAGSGQLSRSLQSLSAELGVGGSVEFLGNVADTDALLHGSSIFLAPAPAEPFGLAVTEAMAHGLPVVAAAGGAHSETLGSKGLFFPPGDFEAAAAQLMRLAGDLDARRAEGGRLRARQQQLFLLDRHVVGLEALYHSILRGRSR